MNIVRVMANTPMRHMPSLRESWTIVNSGQNKQPFQEDEYNFTSPCRHISIGNWLLESKFKISPHALGFQKELFPDSTA